MRSHLSPVREGVPFALGLLECLVYQLLSCLELQGSLFPGQHFTEVLHLAFVNFVCRLRHDAARCPPGTLFATTSRRMNARDRWGSRTLLFCIRLSRRSSTSKDLLECSEDEAAQSFNSEMETALKRPE